MTASPLIGITTGSRNFLSEPFLALMPTYTDAVSLAGGAPVIIPLEQDKDRLRAIYDHLGGIVLSGGGDVAPQHYGEENVSPYVSRVDSKRDDVEMQLIRWALEDDKPLLAICRGIQILNVTLGGSLYQDIPSDIDRALRHDANQFELFYHLTHEILLEPGSRLQQSLAVEDVQIFVNSLHHQALNRVADPLHIVARASDGIIEGVEMPDARFVVGAQWHPEALVTKYDPMRSLFESFVKAVN